jgi:hypothetical protein
MLRFLFVFVFRFSHAFARGERGKPPPILPYSKGSVQPDAVLIYAHDAVRALALFSRF